MTTADTPNRLNELSAQEWLKFTKTWFVHNPPPRKKEEKLHPAKYPENMIAEFIKFFTKPGAVVFDPFVGTGSTLVACHHTNRNGIGIELQQKYARIAKERLQLLESQHKLTSEGSNLISKQLVLQGNSAEIESEWKKYSLPELDLIITSPPYGPMLNKKGLATKEREEERLDTKYSDDPQDLGNTADYGEFIGKLTDIFIKMKPKIKIGGHIVVILQNYMDRGEYKTLAWDVGKELGQHFQFRGERLWLQDNKTLYPYGYKYSFVPNVHHHYCLIFKNGMGKQPEE